MAVMGTLTSQVASLDKKANEITDKFNKDPWAEWKERETSGIGSVHQARQHPVAPLVDDLLIDQQNEFLSKRTVVRWCGYEDL